MAKTDWTYIDTVRPEDMNDIGQEINNNAADITNHISKPTDAHAATAISVTSGTNVQEEIDSLKSSVSDGKNAVAAAIIDMNQVASGTDTFAQLAAKIRNISDDATATPGRVFAGDTFYQGGLKQTGTYSPPRLIRKQLPNHPWVKIEDVGGYPAYAVTYTIPKTDADYPGDYSDLRFVCFTWANGSDLRLGGGYSATLSIAKAFDSDFLSPPQGVYNGSAGAKLDITYNTDGQSGTLQIELTGAGAEAIYNANASQWTFFEVTIVTIA